jgi:predicted nucleic acid-binding protein
MTNILIDSSVWIDYFKGAKNIDDEFFTDCIENNLVCTNNLILAELVPLLLHKKESNVIDILKSIKNVPVTIDWDDIILMQSLNLQHGINKVGIPYLIIIQNVKNNDLKLYSLDKHFKLMKRILKFQLI